MSVFSSQLLIIYNSFIATLPLFAQKFIALFLLVLLVVIYAVFIWKFYRFIATKNILKLNLSKYNKYEHPFLTKIVAGALYLIEYIIILPFLIFFWFGIFTLFLIFLTEGLEVSALLIVSATIVSAIRMTSYYSEDLSRDLAKLLPFTLLAISITKPGFFDVERIINHFAGIPELMGNIAIYLAFIILLEIILRFFDFIFSLFGLEDTFETAEQDNSEETE